MAALKPTTARAGLLIAILVTAEAGDASAKAPGATHCYGGVCHRVLTLAETAQRVGIPTYMHASHYDSCDKDPFNPCSLTSSGTAFQSDRPDNAASSVYPDGTILLTYNPANKLAAVVRVNNLGPFRGNRLLDVSRATADRLGFSKQGVAKLQVTVLKAPTQSETNYQKHRTYSAVPGFMGKINTQDDALATAAGKVGTGLPRLRPIIAGQTTEKPAKLMPELPMTTTVARYAIGVIGLLFPPAMALLGEPAKTQTKTAERNGKAGEKQTGQVASRATAAAKPKVFDVGSEAGTMTASSTGSIAVGWPLLAQPVKKMGLGVAKAEATAAKVKPAAVVAKVKATAKPEPAKIVATSGEPKASQTGAKANAAATAEKSKVKPTGKIEMPKLAAKVEKVRTAALTEKFKPEPSETRLKSSAVAEKPKPQAKARRQDESDDSGSELLSTLPNQ